MKLNSSYILAVLAGIMLAGWAGLLALIVLVIASARDEEWTRGWEDFFRP